MTESTDSRIKGPGPGGDSPKTSAKDRDMRAAYGAATKRLREAHRDEFNEYQKEEAKKLGIDWSPKPTAEEKARAQFQELLAQHPGLASEVGAAAVQPNAQGIPPEGAVPQSPVSQGL